MEKKYGLTNTELALMEYFWDQKEEVAFKDLLLYVNDVLNKNWRRQTLSTYLKNLQMYGLVGAVNDKKNYGYYAICTKEEHIHKWTKKLVEKSYGDSVEKFMIAFSGGKKLNKEVADRLRELL